MRLAHLLVTAGALLALGLACYPSAPCVTSCGVTFEGRDCAGFEQLEQRTVEAFATCDAGSPDDACAELAGWRVVVLPVDQTHPLDGAGDRWFPAPGNDEGVVEAYGTTDCYGLPLPDGGLDHRPTITLADEHWASGVASTELVHAATRECLGNPYRTWKDNGRRCVVNTARQP